MKASTGSHIYIYMNGVYRGRINPKFAMNQVDTISTSISFLTCI